MVLNVVMVGFFAAVSGLLKPESLRQAVADSVPPAFKDLNLRAFDKGLEYGLGHLQAQPREEAFSVPEES
jgi:2-oxoglutarate ferredoxin oxidoreductase subunit gamma